MSGYRLTAPVRLAAIQALAILCLCACATLPATPDQGVSMTSTRPPGATPTPPKPSSTPTPVPSPTATNTLVAVPFRTDTPTPTEPPLAVSDPGLGYDCTQVERLPVNSNEARALAEALVASYKEKLPTEYIAIEDLWAVERLDKYVVIQMRITDEAAGIYVIRQPPAGPGKMPHEDAQVEYLAGHVWGGWPFPSRFTLPELLTAQLPDAPPELFYCMSLGYFFFDVQAQEELDLRRHFDCSLVQTLPPDSPMGWAISDSLVDYWSGVVEVAPVELDQVYSIQQLGPFYAIQVRFFVNHRSEPPEIFIARAVGQDYEFIAQTSGGGPDRTYLVRTLYAQDSSIPAELLACLNLNGFLLDTPTPAPGE